MTDIFMVMPGVVQVGYGAVPTGYTFPAAAAAKMNINVSPNPLGTVYATKRRRRSNKRCVE